MQSGNGRGVQLAEVSAAADALLARGQRPTVERVRQQLGRGSPNTVGPMLETWFAGLAPRLGIGAMAPDASNVVPTALRSSMEAVWEQAVEVARKESKAELAEQMSQLELERSRLNEQRIAFSNESEALSEREALRTAALERSQSQADALIEQLRALQASLDQRDDDLATTRISLAKAIEARDTASREHMRIIQNMDTDRRSLEARYVASEHRHLEEVDRARLETKSLQKFLTTSESKVAALTKSLEESQHRVHALQAETAAQRVLLAANEERIKDLRAVTVKHRAKPISKRAKHST